MSRHRRSTTRGLVLRVVAVTALVILAAWAIYSLGRSSVALPGPDPARVRLAVVDSVLDGRTVLLRGDAQPIQIAGLDVPAPDQCGAVESTRHAREVLAGETVTVVPDARDPKALHLVLATQQSYTDDAIVNGWARLAPGLLTYQAVFFREQEQAADEKRGLWATCWRRPS